MLTTNKAVYGTDGSLIELGKLKGSASGDIQQSKTYTFEGSSDGILIDYKDVLYYTYTCYRYTSEENLIIHHGILFYDEGVEDEMGGFTDPSDVIPLNAYYTDDPNKVLIKDEGTYSHSFIVLNSWF